MAAPVVIEYHPGPGEEEEDYLIRGLPRRAELVRRENGGACRQLQGLISRGDPVPFLPVTVREEVYYTGGAEGYQLSLHGVLPDGSKGRAAIRGARPFLHVRRTERIDSIAALRELFLKAPGRPPPIKSFVEESGYPFKGYSENREVWFRVTFDTTYSRSSALRFLKSGDHETASDDAHHRLVARTLGFVYTDWNLLGGYQYYKGGGHPGVAPAKRRDPKEWAHSSPLSEHVFVVDLPRGSIAPVVDPMAPREKQEDGELVKKERGFLRDKTLVMAWDIETRNTAATGTVPLATEESSSVFMVGATFHWKDEKAPLLRVCLVDTPAEGDEGWATVVCDGEGGIVRAFAALFRQLAPDVVADFNGGTYDWPFMLETARNLGLTGLLFTAMAAAPPRPKQLEALRRPGVYAAAPAQEKRGQGRGGFTPLLLKRGVKLSAQDPDRLVICPDVPGFVCVDVYVAFRKLYPKAEKSSLNAFLALCNLEAKEDMPYGEMWAIRAEPRPDPARMRDVARYCVVDAQRCQELLLKRSVLRERREVALLSYTTLHEAVFYADGMRVEGMLAAHAARRGIMFTSVGRYGAARGAEKFPGAWVFPPEKGLSPDPTAPRLQDLEKARAAYAATEDGGALEEALAASARRAAETADARLGRPVTGLDFSSLYPSIIMAYNLSPEKFVATRAEAEKLKSEGLDLHETSFEYGGRTVGGWFIRHGGAEDAYGLYPSILRDLFDRRRAMKKRLAVLEKTVEEMDLFVAGAAAAAAALAAARLPSGEGQESPVPPFLAEVDRLAGVKGLARAEAFDAYYADTAFALEALDSKQKALKVYMNTFYGQAGNSGSAVYLLELAGGVTEAGRRNIRLVADYVVKERGFALKYGDTDSLYLCAPEDRFREADRAYARGALGKKEYWARMVEITMEALGELRGDVNRFLAEDNKTQHLKMAYEEVLYPVAFLAKKMYFGIAHVSAPNFEPKSLFMRGISVVRRGQSEFAKKISYEILWKAVAVDNGETLLPLVENTLAECLAFAGSGEGGGGWIFDDFVKTETWRPAKDNQKVQAFVGRLRARRAAGAPCELPTPGERFRYVLVRPPAAFSAEGKKLVHKVGDLMEYADEARARGLGCVNIEKYIEGEVLGTCARFVASSPVFADKACSEEEQVKKATKHLTGVIARIRGEAPRVVQKRGAAYKRAWKAAKARHDGGPDAAAFAAVPAPLRGGGLPSRLAEEAAAAAAGRGELSFDFAAYCAALGFSAATGGDLGNSDSAGRLYAALAAVAGPAGRARGFAAQAGRLYQERRALAERRLEEEALGRLAALAEGLTGPAGRYEAALSHEVMVERRREHASAPEELGLLAETLVQGTSGAAAPPPFALDEGERALLAEALAAHRRLAALHLVRAERALVARALKALRDKRLKRGAPAEGGEQAESTRAYARRLPALGVSPDALGPCSPEAA